MEAFPARKAVLGALQIRRALPVRGRRLVGPWCFLDRYGPLTFSGGKPMDVAPHPHLGLQTVSWLLDGEIVHNDSLGCEGLIRPGELSLMTAGHGITHAEETPASNSGRLNGVQLWVALPDAARHCAPSYEHRVNIPEVTVPGARASVILGSFAGFTSAGTSFSPLCGVELVVEHGARVEFPLENSFEYAVIILDGTLEVERQILEPDTLYYLGAGRGEIGLASKAGGRALLVGGLPFGETVLMWWNFVARTAEELAEARLAWESHERFPAVKAYHGERLAAPAFVPRPPRRD